MREAVRTRAQLNFFFPFYFLFCFIILYSASPALAEELPRPSYHNALIVSFEHNVTDSAEVELIKKSFPFGLYAWLSFSLTTLTPSLDWHWNLSDASNGLQSFKTQVTDLVSQAKEQQVRFHLVLTSGLARGLSVYREAKEEDIRNCQWYNDNKLAADDQINHPEAMNRYIFGTLSRYARKVRANLEAKAKASLAFLKQLMDLYPDTLIALSGWGEAELNYNRINHLKSVQDFFCDYSPFAILEFRDWVCHTGMYDDTNGKYKGEGYPGGGTKYQGTAGLAQFNLDFGTNFTTWDLKYFNWSLTDDYDSNPEDNVNPDPNKIPWSSYVHGGMMPTSGKNYLEGGFDPPRVMKPGDKFWDLWNLFRETMVANFVRDVAKWAFEAGIPSSQWFSHQIPGDYLFGTNPSMPNKNARYYTGASPLWTANIIPYGSPGGTIYDIKFPDWFARTTEYGVPAIAKMSSNWAIMEYDAETYPIGFNVSQSSAEFILEQYLRIYQHNVHLINFWRWWDTSGEHRIKGMNKEVALREFIRRVRDKARRTDLNLVFDPPAVAGVWGKYVPEKRVMRLELGGRIWPDLEWMWKDWGDWAHFEVFRGEEAGFPLDVAHRVGTTKDYVFEDSSVVEGKVYYYRVRAVNVKGVAGPASSEIRLPGYTLTLAATTGGTTDPAPGAYTFEPGASVSIQAIPDPYYEFIGWSGDATGKTNPLTVVMDRDKNILANFLRITVYPPLNVQGIKLVNRSLAQAEYIIKLTWEANPNNKFVSKYRIYRLEGSNRLFEAEVSATTFEYLHRRAAKDKTYTFAVVTVNGSNEESEPAIVVVY